MSQIIFESWKHEDMRTPIEVFVGKKSNVFSECQKCFSDITIYHLSGRSFFPVRFAHESWTEWCKALLDQHITRRRGSQGHQVRTVHETITTSLNALFSRVPDSGTPTPCSLHSAYVLEMKIHGRAVPTYHLHKKCKVLLRRRVFDQQSRPAIKRQFEKTSLCLLKFCLN